ncbi:MAG: LacI family transcriptional regulator [Lactobacillaceae bacterium]|jgi:LacI family transcriptional regulator|nr:LacI family transcriptional regulator [Lactobacillaceae bacterium]
MAKTSIRDVAEEAGVSTTTVSQILNNKGDRFPAATIKKVLAAKRDLGYVPNKNAQGMRGTQKPLVGILVPSLRNPFFADLMQSVQQHAQGQVDLIFQSVPDNEVRQGIETLVERGVTGLIVARPLPDGADVAHFLKMRGIATVMLDQSDDFGITDMVSTDDLLGGQLVAEFLAKQQHTAVAIVQPTMLTHNMELRMQGFTDAWLADRTHTMQIIQTNMSKHGGIQVSQAVLATGVTAVFAINDEMAIGLLRGFANLGVDVPNDMSVIGYDDTDYAEFVIPALTTVNQPVWEIGELALDYVLARLQTPDAPLKKTMLPVRLIKRESTK